MGKNKNRNKPNKNSSNINTHKQSRMPGHSTSSIATTSSSDVGASSSPIRRTFDGSSEESSTASDAASTVSSKLPPPAEKRDSVISSDWEVLDKRRKSQPKLATRSRWRLEPGNWWPCRIYREISSFAIALVRAAQGPRRADFILTVFLGALVMFAGYTAMGLLSSIFKVAAAQGTAVDADCSIVYVTVPGPIITVSLVNASPSNPARGTYYFSVVNGTTEWMNSIAPPSRFSTLVTRTPEVTPIISSMPNTPTTGLPSATSAGIPAPGVPPLAPGPSIPATTITTTFLSGTSLVTTVITSQPSASQILSPPSTSARTATPSTSQILSLPSTSAQTAAPSTNPYSVGQPLRPWPSGSGYTGSLTGTTLPSLPGSPGSVPSLTPSMGTPGVSSLASGSTALGLSSPSIPATTAPDSPASPTSPVISSVLITITSVASNGLTTVLTRTTPTTVSEISVPVSNTPSVSSTSTSLVTFTSTIPNGPTTILTSTSTTIVVGSPAVSSAASLAPTPSSVGPTPIRTLPSGASESNVPSLPSIASTPGLSTVSSLQGSLPSSLSSGQTSAFSSLTPSMISPPPGGSASDSSVVVPSNVASAPSTSIAQTQSIGTAPPPLNRPSSAGSLIVPSNSLSIPSTSAQATSGVSVTVALPSSTSATGLSSSFSSPGSPASNFPPSFIAPTETSAISVTSPGVPTISSSNLLSTSNVPGSPSSAFPSPAPSPSPGPSGSAAPPIDSVTSSRNSTLSTAITPDLPSLSSMSTRNSTSSSTSALSSSSVAASGAPITGPATTFRTLVPPANVSTSSSSMLSSFSILSSRASSTSSSILSASSLTGSTSLRSSSNTASGSNPSVSSRPTSLASPSGSLSTLPFSSTTVPPASTDPGFFARGSVTRIISFGDEGISFVFPRPDITTTVSYWSGLFPTVTGPLPSDLQTVPPTTRSTVQTPISAPPPFSSASSRPRFRTVVTTIFEDGPIDGLARRQEATSVVQTVLTTLVPEDPTPTPDFSAVEAPGPTSCGESGKFVLNFDDTVVPNADQVLNADGLTNPYHHLFYANGYTDVSDKWEPYPAISQPNIAMFLPLTGKLFANQPFSGTLLPGEIGAGPRASVDAYWFNAYSGYFGCALNGITDCTLHISGYRYDAVLKGEVLVAQQNVTLPACFGYIKCRLTQVFFDDGFQALSGIQFRAYTANLGIPQVHMMDDLALEWYNNTCSAGILRIGHS